MINNPEKIKNEVFAIIGDNNKCFDDNEQFCFACGVAFMALLYVEDDTDEANTTISNNLLHSANLTQLKEKIINLVNQNLDYVENLPFYKKNLFTYIAKYDPNADELCAEYGKYLAYGTLNLATFYESELIKLANYAKIHGVPPSAVRYHIYNENLKTAQKVGRFWIININEPYPDSKAKRKTP